MRKKILMFHNLQSCSDYEIYVLLGIWPQVVKHCGAGEDYRQAWRSG